MSKAKLYRWACLVIGTSVLAVGVGSCDMQSIIGQVLGGLTGV